ncbi:hypothetical protein MJO28_014898 [Puccinia striiformis f. sp. tritici]|uniref:Uncharacterized protein n=1 Tax=Puccinia striiformis f. sp. tritici TaxID=168172 RepID=A0ACC0DTZ1_9BASI|nr:hypothetical protein MJO28_014898 [Puccinia striiformis f. sp. tritici]
MWHEFSEGLPFRVTNPYKNRIRNLEEVVRLLLARQEPSPFRLVSSAPLVGSFRYSLEHGLIPVLSKSSVESLAYSQSIRSQFPPPVRAKNPRNLIRKFSLDQTNVRQSKSDLADSEIRKHHKGIITINSSVGDPASPLPIVLTPAIKPFSKLDIVNSPFRLNSTVADYKPWHHPDQLGKPSSAQLSVSLVKPGPTKNNNSEPSSVSDAKTVTLSNHNSRIDIGNDLEIATGFANLTAIRDQPIADCIPSFRLHSPDRLPSADFISPVRSNSPARLPSPPSGFDSDIINKQALTSITRSFSRLHRKVPPPRSRSLDHLPLPGGAVASKAKDPPVIDSPPQKIASQATDLPSTSIAKVGALAVMVLDVPPPKVSTNQITESPLPFVKTPPSLSNQPADFNTSTPIVTPQAIDTPPTPGDPRYRPSGDSDLPQWKPKGRKRNLSSATSEEIDCLALISAVNVVEEELPVMSTDGVTIGLYTGIDPASLAALWDIPEDDSDEEDVASPPGSHLTLPLPSLTLSPNPDSTYPTPSQTLASLIGTPNSYNLAAMGLVLVLDPTEGTVNQQTATEYERLLHKAELADYLEYLRECESTVQLDQPPQILQ